MYMLIQYYRKFFPLWIIFPLVNFNENHFIQTYSYSFNVNVIITRVSNHLTAVKGLYLVLHTV
jgi:hypothetical protein